MSASTARHWEQDKDATIYVGNIDERVTDALIWELMLQAGRIVNVHLPKDRVSQHHSGFGFVEFISEEDADYAAKIMNTVRLYGKPIKVNKASADKQKAVEVGAELFIGNLDPMVDEKVLYDTFSRFGGLVAPPKVARDDDNLSKGYGFVSFANFESSDEAVANMNGQFLMNKEIVVQYAYKKDGKGERHGDEAERMLAAQARKHNVEITPQQMPPQLYQPQQAVPPAMPNGGMMDPRMGAPTPPMPVGFGGPPQGYPAMPAGFAPPQNYQNVAPPNQQQQRPAPPPSQPLPPPPSGLPSRPPPSQAGYGGPPSFRPAGFQGAPSGAPAAPPPGFAPPGFGPPPGQPQQMPQGYPPQGYPPRR